MSDIVIPRGDPNTLRILEMDGGGERGYLSLQFLKRIVAEWGINDYEIWKYFDTICGTSVGGIMGLGIAAGIPLCDIEKFFTEQGPSIFTLGVPGLNAIGIIEPGIRPNSVEKYALIAEKIPFYQSSGLFEEKYGAGLLRKTIRDLFGTLTLKDLKTKVLIPAIRKDPILNSEGEITAYDYQFITFSNIDHPEFKGMNELVSDIALSTSAAPVYLPEYTFVNSQGETHTYIDGGIYNNNPALFGRNIAQIIKPTLRRTCILSIGTGLSSVGFDVAYEAPTEPPTDPTEELIVNSLLTKKTRHLKQKEACVYGRNYNHLKSKKSFDDPTVDPTEIIGNLVETIEDLYQLFTLASVGGQESVSRTLYLESEYGGTQLYNYRFQPRLNPNYDTGLDNTDQEILDYYSALEEEWSTNDATNITNFLGHLRR